MNKDVFRKLALLLDAVIFGYLLYINIKYGFPTNVKQFFYSIAYLLFLLINIIAII